MDTEKLRRYTLLAQQTIYSEEDEGNFHNVLIPEMVKRYFPNELPKEAMIVDIGCGPGVFAENMRGKGYENVVGVTMSGEDYRACLAKGLPTLHCDMTDIPLPDHLTGMVWCRHALEHSPYPLLTLFEFNRLLANGGALYVEVPAPDGQRNHEANPNHYSVLGVRMWASLFKRAGFEILRSDTTNVNLTFPQGPVVESYLCFLLRKSVDILHA